MVHDLICWLAFFFHFGCINPFYVWFSYVKFKFWIKSTTCSIWITEWCYIFWYKCHHLLPTFDEAISRKCRIIEQAQHMRLWSDAFSNFISENLKQRKGNKTTKSHLCCMQNLSCFFITWTKIVMIPHTHDGVHAFKIFKLDPSFEVLS